MEKKPLKEDSNPHKLLDLIPRERKWPIKIEDGGNGGGGGGGGSTSHHGSSADKSLELRLGLPGGDDDEESKPKKKEGYNGNYNNHNYQLFSMGYFSSLTHSNSTTKTNPPSPWGYARTSSQPFNSRMVDLPTDTKKRAAPAPVVGWPPIRSSRRNLASSSSARLVPDPPRAAPALPVKATEKPAENCSHKGLFVKINMEGVPIGRKVDLRAHNNYDKLCLAVGTLFRRLLIAQMDSSSCGVRNQQDGEKPITGLLDGSGEYTLVYEDNEGDRMLVGDVPWSMFVSTVKRLRVLKTSEMPSLSKVAGGKGKLIKGE